MDGLLSGLGICGTFQWIRAWRPRFPRGLFNAFVFLLSLAVLGPQWPSLLPCCALVYTAPPSRSTASSRGSWTSGFSLTGSRGSSKNCFSDLKTRRTTAFSDIKSSPPYRRPPLWLLPSGGCGSRALRVDSPVAAASSKSRICCCQSSPSQYEADGEGGPSDSLRGVRVFVTPLMNIPDVWGELPRVLRGPAPYEATAVARLRAAGASLYVTLAGSRKRRIPQGPLWSSRAEAPEVLRQELHLIVSALPPLRRASSGASSAAAGRPQGAPEEQRISKGHPMAFSPTRGIVSSFGCFSAAEHLVGERLHSSEGATTATAAAGDVGPSLPLGASWGAPALWLCGSEASILNKGFRVITGVDSLDLQTLHLQHQLRQQQQQHQQQGPQPPTRVAFLRTGDEGPPTQATTVAGLVPQEQLMLQQLQDQQHLKAWVPARPPLCCLDAGALSRATIGNALLQCCEAVGLLLRIGQGSDREETRPSGSSSDEGHQEHQQQQQGSYVARVFKNRTEGLSPTLKRKLLLGGTVLSDPRHSILLRGAQSAQRALQLHFERLLSEADVLIHLAGDPKGRGAGSSSSRIDAPSGGTNLARTRQDLLGSNPQLAYSHVGGANSKVAPPIRKMPITGELEGASEGPHEQLLAAATTAGLPCFASANGWLLLGRPGSDSLVLGTAAALCNRHR